VALCATGSLLVNPFFGKQQSKPTDLRIIKAFLHDSQEIFPRGIGAPREPVVVEFPEQFQSATIWIHGDNALAATIRDVANLAEVSIATVSRVINGCSKVSVEKTGRVLSAISQLNYRPNAIAAALSRNGGNPKRRNRQPLLDNLTGHRESLCPTNRTMSIRKLKNGLPLMQENQNLRLLIADLITIIDEWKIRAEHAQVLHIPSQDSMRRSSTGKAQRYGDHIESAVRPDQGTSRPSHK